MNICIFQHVPFEGAGTILPYFEERGHQVEMVHLYTDHQLPDVSAIDLLIVIGGPMSVHDIDEHPFLIEEKRFIREAVEQGKWLLGVCLGSQLIAEALGSKVRKNKETEIGWFPVSQTQNASQSWLADLLPCEFTCLHWHGDTFDLPERAVHVARSPACENQAFVWNDRVIGLQFHLEFTPDSTRALIEKARDELVDGPWIQTEQEMLRDKSMFDTANNLMAGLLLHIESEIEFQLHPQLEKDTHFIAELDCSRVLLNKNAEIPWFILVPRGDYRDLDDMQKLRRNRLLAESDKIADLLRDEFSAEKINVAALGNMVPQLHLHVIGRRADDPCWPNPIWGNLNTESAWSEGQIERLRKLTSRF